MLFKDVTHNMLHITEYYTVSSTGRWLLLYSHNTWQFSHNMVNTQLFHITYFTQHSVIFTSRSITPSLALAAACSRVHATYAIFTQHTSHNTQPFHIKCFTSRCIMPSLALAAACSCIHITPWHFHITYFTYHSAVSHNKLHITLSCFT